MDRINQRRFVAFLSLAILVLVLLLVVAIFRALATLHSTGILLVEASDNTAAITISQPNKQAALLGIGRTKTRLKPGVYFLAANSKGMSATQVVKISKSGSTKASLNSAKASPKLATVDTVGFINFDLLIDNGLSSTQVTNLKQLFFTHKPSAKLVTIDAASVLPEPHDRNSDNIWFGIDFDGSIDSTPFRARVLYSGFDPVELTLTDPQTGATLYADIIPGSSGD